MRYDCDPEPYKCYSTVADVADPDEGDLTSPKLDGTKFEYKFGFIMIFEVLHINFSKRY